MKMASRKIDINSNEVRMLIVFAAILLIGIVTKPSVFFTFDTAEAVCRQCVEYGLLTLGVTICMMSGGIDLSAVYLANLCSIIIGMYLKMTVAQDGTINMAALTGGILITVFAGMIGGMLNGFLVGKLQLPAMLVTLGTGQLFMGASLILTKGKALNEIPNIFYGFANTNIFGIPVLFLAFVVVVIILCIFMNKSRFGAETFMIGTNQKASLYSGLNTAGVLIRTYTISGILASFAGIVIIARNNSGKADFGTSYILQTILIAVLGGTDPEGGEGSIAAVAIAVVIMQMISSLFNMYGSVINTFYRNIVWGLLLLFTLILNSCLRKNKTKNK